MKSFNIQQERTAIFQIAANKVLSERELVYLTNAELTERLSFETQQLILGFRAWILKGEHPEERYSRTIEYPQDWWEHFKARWFPSWLKKRFPVRYHKDVIETHRSGPIYVCPHSNYKFPDKRHFEWLRYGPSGEEKGEVA